MVEILNRSERLKLVSHFVDADPITVLTYGLGMSLTL